MTRTGRRNLIASSALCLAGLWAVCGCSSYTNAVQDEYACLQVGDMVVVHLNRYEGTVPESWSDLEEEYRTTQESYNSFTFRQLRERVTVNFGQLADWKSTGDDSNFIALAGQVRGSSRPKIERLVNDKIAQALSRYRNGSNQRDQKGRE